MAEQDHRLQGPLLVELEAAMGQMREELAIPSLSGYLLAEAVEAGAVVVRLRLLELEGMERASGQVAAEVALL